MHRLFHTYALALLLPYTQSHCQQVHYHIIPAPRLSSLPTGVGPANVNQKPPLVARDMHQEEYELRDDLNKDDAHALVERIKAHL